MSHYHFTENKVSSPLHRIFQLYVQAPEHPAKMRLEHWLARWLLPYHGAPYRVNSGVRMLLHPKDWIEYLLIKTGSYEPETLNFVTRNLRAGDSAFFAGVNFGLHVVVAAGHVGPEGRVIGIEPQPRSLCRTLENLRLNGLGGNVVLVSGALGAGRELLPMEEAPSENSGLATLRDGGFKSKLRISVQPVEEIAAGLACLEPRVFLIDVEGFEEMVVDGFGRSFRPDLLVVEINREILSLTAGAEERLFEKLRSFGYDLYDLKGNPASSGVDLIEANVVGVRQGKKTLAWA